MTYRYKMDKKHENGKKLFTNRVKSKRFALDNVGLLDTVHSRRKTRCG